MKKAISFSFLVLLFVSCSTIDTKDANEAYQYWAGTKPPKEIELINGQYFQSPHFTLEYELFLKFKTNKRWFNEYIKINKLEKDTVLNEWSGFTSLPEWFKPDSSFVIYSRNPGDEFERSRYFIHPESGMCYIYETVGM